MRVRQASKVLSAWDRKGRYVFTTRDLRTLFPEDNPKAFNEGLRRLVKAGILVRACRGVYVNKEAASTDSYIIENIAKALRRGKYSYVGLESMLSEYGVTSQVPIDRLAVMTTGRKGVYKTPFGVVEFTHTKRSIKNIIDNTHKVQGKPLRIASKATALRDLKRVGRNLALIKGAE